MLPVKGEPQVVDGFRLRGTDVTRLEGFSDAVFGFALTLLVVSLDVPRNYGDLIESMRGFPAFAVCFLFLALLWNSHYKFCRRFGLHDGFTRFLTCILLFLVLFYIYPLKFLFTLSITNLLFGRAAAHIAHITAPQLSTLLLIYGIGFAAVYFALCLLYLHAYRLRDQLELSEQEKFETRYQIHRFYILIAVGLLASGLAQVRAILFWSGWTYLILFPLLRTYKIIHRRQRARRFPVLPTR